MNLLYDPIFRVQTSSGEIRMSLPSLFEALGQNKILSYAGLQRHQEDAFHIFLCYLAGAVLARKKKSDPVQEEVFWKEGLQNLSGEAGDSAWNLVEKDLTKPAFMQPPLPDIAPNSIGPKALTPDALDLLPTAKNHDVKSARAEVSELDEWVYALVSLQTMSGFFGRGNQGISRMNSGFGNRVVVEVLHSLTPGERFCHSLIRLLYHRAEILKGAWGYDPNGLVLVWTEPWDGKNALPLKGLDPFYVEICRRIRFCWDQSRNKLWAGVCAADKPRIAARELNGNVGDAWAPVDLSQDTVLTVSNQGITAELLRRLLFEDGIGLTHLHKPLPNFSGPVWLSVSVLVRGKGTTEGFHEKLIRIPANARKRIFAVKKTEQEVLAGMSRNAIEQADYIRYRVLRPAVFEFIEGGPKKVKMDRDAAAAWWTRCAIRFEAAWSDAYFPWLWQATEMESVETALLVWVKQIQKVALNVLKEAHETMPSPTGRTYRARVLSEQLFWKALYKNFPILKEERYGAVAKQ